MGEEGNEGVGYLCVREREEKGGDEGVCVREDQARCVRSLVCRYVRM